MAISVAKAKKLATNRGAAKSNSTARQSREALGLTPAQAKAQRAKLTKRQIAKRKGIILNTRKRKPAKLTKRQINKRRAKGITTASVVSRSPITTNRATVQRRVPAKRRQVNFYKQVRGI